MRISCGLEVAAKLVLLWIAVDDSLVAVCQPPSAPLALPLGRRPTVYGVPRTGVRYGVL